MKRKYSNNDLILKNGLILLIVILVSFYINDKNYILFHTLIHIFTSVIAFSILVVGVNTYGISKDNFFIFLGIGYAFVGVFNIIHSISYPGMGILSYDNLNFSLQAAAVSTYLESITTLFAYVLLKDRKRYLKPCTGLYICIAIGGAIILTLTSKNIIPPMINDLNEATGYKHISQFILLGMYFVAGIIFYRERKSIDGDLYIYIEHHIGARIASIVFFILSKPYDSYTVLLHVSKLMAFYFIYKAFIEVGLKAPYKKLYYELSETNERLEHENEVRRNIEESLIKNEQVYKLLIENSKDILVIHSEGRIVFANEQALRLLKVDNIEDILNKPVNEFIAEGELNTVCEKISSIYREKAVVPFFETKLLTNQRQEILVEASGIYLVFNGKPAVAAIVRDLSYKKQVEELAKGVVESTKLLQESREYNRLITEFIANISHEVRTPLNVILGAVQLMDLQGNDSKYLGTVKQNCFRLLRMVNNLIDISKIDSGYFELSPRNCNLVAVVEDITLSVAGYIENKGVELIFDTDTEEKIMACDLDMMERIMLNLLSNAVKFTGPGDTINVDFIDEGESVKIIVKDTGIGIPEDKQQVIFERFRQVDKSFTRKHEGSGIGLALVKSLVDLHGGSIELKSFPGKGSEFIITLPAVEHVELSSETKIDYGSNVERISIEFSDIYLNS